MSDPKQNLRIIALSNIPPLSRVFLVDVEDHLIEVAVPLLGTPRPTNIKFFAPPEFLLRVECDGYEPWRQDVRADDCNSIDLEMMRFHAPDGPEKPEVDHDVCRCRRLDYDTGLCQECGRKATEREMIENLRFDLRGACAHVDSLQRHLAKARLERDEAIRQAIPRIQP